MKARREEKDRLRRTGECAAAIRLNGAASLMSFARDERIGVRKDCCKWVQDGKNPSWA